MVIGTYLYTFPLPHYETNGDNIVDGHGSDNSCLPALTWTAVRLKVLLRAYGLSDAGRKSELFYRLASHLGVNPRQVKMNAIRLR